MNWQAIGAVSEIIGALGVIVSLAYLAFQIRQNTKQLEQNERTSMAAAVSVSATNYRENRKFIYTSPEVSELCFKGMADPESLNELERYRFRLLISNMVDAHLDMYVQTVLAGFSPETWATQGRRVIHRVLSTPGGRWFWKHFGSDYSDEFRREVDHILDSRPTESASSPAKV